MSVFRCYNWKHAGKATYIPYLPCENTWAKYSTSFSRYIIVISKPSAAAAAATVSSFSSVSSSFSSHIVVHYSLTGYSEKDSLYL